MTQEFYWILVTIVLMVITLSIASLNGAGDSTINPKLDKFFMWTFISLGCFLLTLCLYIAIRYGLTLDTSFTPLGYQNN